MRDYTDMTISIRPSNFEITEPDSLLKVSKYAENATFWLPKTSLFKISRLFTDVSLIKIDFPTPNL